MRVLTHTEGPRDGGTEGRARFQPPRLPSGFNPDVGHKGEGRGEASKLSAVKHLRWCQLFISILNYHE